MTEFRLPEIARRSRVAIIGAGIVGATCAVELVRDGHEVTLVDPAVPGADHAASFGNAGWISPASIIPMSVPGLWRKLPGYLADPRSPLAIRWRHVPELAPWLARFLAAGMTWPRVQRLAGGLAGLLLDAPGRHLALADTIGKPALIQQRGVLYAYPDRQAFSAQAQAWRIRRDNGVAWSELDGPEMRRENPYLSDRYGFGVVVDAAASCTDPGKYTASLAQFALNRGANMIRARATGFGISGGSARSVTTDAGSVDCDFAVVCAGIASRALAAAAGDRIPLVSERGYHVMLSGMKARGRPFMTSDGLMGVTPMEGGLRVAGQVELAGSTSPPDWRRAESLAVHLAAALPAAAFSARDGIAKWLGHRPSTPDSLPVIGRSGGSANILYAFGHGHTGLAGAPRTATLIADLVAGREPGIAMAPYDARRFRVLR